MGPIIDSHASYCAVGRHARTSRQAPSSDGLCVVIVRPGVLTSGRALHPGDVSGVGGTSPSDGRRATGISRRSCRGSPGGARDGAARLPGDTDDVPPDGSRNLAGWRVIVAIGFQFGPRIDGDQERDSDGCIFGCRWLAAPLRGGLRRSRG